MDLDSLIKKMARLEFHQSLLMEMMSNSDDHFYQLMIRHSLERSDLEDFNQLCEHLTLLLSEQKEEGFIYFESLFNQFKEALHPSLDVEEVIHACLHQRIFVPLMLELKKFL